MLHGLILYPRATRSTDRPWRPVYPSEATSGYDIWPCRGQPPSWGKRVRVRSIPMAYGQKTNHRRFPVDPTSHMPTIRESVPPDHRTKRCRRGSEGLLKHFASQRDSSKTRGFLVFLCGCGEMKHGRFLAVLDCLWFFWKTPFFSRFRITKNGNIWRRGQHGRTFCGDRRPCFS